MEKDAKFEIYEDEIDLYELWLVLKKRKKIIFLSSLFCIFIAAIFVIVTPSLYEGKFVIKSDFASPYQLKRAVENLNLLIFQQDKSVYRYFEQKILENISDIKANIPRMDKTILEVSFLVRDPQFIPKIQEGIIKYLESLYFLQQQVSWQKKKMEEMLSVLQRQLKDMYSIKKELSKSNDIDFEELVKIELAIKKMSQDIIDTRLALSRLKPIKILISSPIPQEPSKPKRKLIMAVSVVSGLFLGIFLAFFLEWLEASREKHKKQIG